MGCGGSVPKPKEPPHPAIDEDWALKAEATRIFKLADVNNNGELDLDELAATLRSAKLVNEAMKNLDLDMNGTVSLREWLIAMRTTFDKSESACAYSLKQHEKAITASRAAITEAPE